MRVGLVLGAGGLAGTAYHAGAIAALDDAGWDARSADLLIGTSAGSVSAALLRAGLAPGDFPRRMSGRPLSDEGRRLLQHLPSLPSPPDPPPGAPWWRRGPASPDTLRDVARRPWRVSPGHLLAATIPAGRRPVEEMAGGIDTLFPDGWPPRSLWITMADLRAGRTVVAGRDDDAPRCTVGQAVAASCAVPGYFAPVTIDGRQYVDGGVGSSTHADLLVGERLDLVVVSAPMSSHDDPGLDPRQAWRHWVRRRLRGELGAIRAAGIPVLVMAPTAADRLAIGTATMDASRRGAIATSVRESAAGIIAAADPGVRSALSRRGGPRS